MIKDKKSMRITSEYDPRNKEYIIRIPRRLLETKEGIEYFHETILKGISDDALVKEQTRRIKHRNGDWATWNENQED